MIVCLAALEGCKDILEAVDDHYLKYGLISFYYLKNQEALENILKKVDYLLIDSGAFSFQHGKKVDFEDFTNKYIEFVERNKDNPQILGFFEMDIDNIVGYEKVKEYKKRLDAVSDKIIPVWHQNRGIEDFIEMCKEHSGKRVAISGFTDRDIRDSQFNLFINTAHSYNCKVHVLALTRYDLIQNLNLGKYDSVDSSTWLQASVFNEINMPVKKYGTTRKKFLRGIDFKRYLLRLNFTLAKIMQENYIDFDNSIYGGNNK